MEFLNEVGPYVLILLLVLVVALIGWIAKVQGDHKKLLFHYRKLVQGSRGNLDEVLDKHLATVDGVSRRVDALTETVRRVDRDMAHSVQRVGVVRYNPFEDTGGDQSFSVALLDRDNNGVLLTSIFSRAQCRVYAKPVQHGQSTYQLSVEESSALRLASGDRSTEGARAAVPEPPRDQQDPKE